MRYNPRMIGDKDNVRYALVQKGERTLYVVGLNPSTADDKKADLTMTKIMGFAEKNGYDGFVMFNLYPQRSTYPKRLQEEKDETLYTKNLDTIKKYLSEEVNPTVLLCYGNNVRIRHYLKESVVDLVNICKHYEAKIVCIGATKSGNPKHPSRTAYGFFVDYMI